MKLNGNTKWVFGILLALLIGVGGWYGFAVQAFANAGHSEISRSNERQDIQIAKVEVRLSELEQRQSSIEGKLDVILKVVQNLDRRSSR